jgi:Predicted membrane protein
MWEVAVGEDSVEQLAGEVRDATRRTHLANERTYLAWWRTGLTCLVVSLGAGKLIPSISHQARWPYVVLGAGFGLLGLAFIAYGLRRQRETQGAVRQADFEHPEDRVLAALTAAGLLLGTLLLALVVIQT